MTLGRKEIGILACIGVLVFGILYYFLLISPALSRQKALEGHIRKREADLKRMMELKAAWEDFTGRRQKADRLIVERGEKFALLSFLEGVSREVGVDKQVQYMKPVSFPAEPGALQQVGMEVRLEEIGIRQLVDYLHKIEYAGKLLKIRRIRIESSAAREGPATLKVTLQVATYVQAAQSG